RGALHGRRSTSPAACRPAPPRGRRTSARWDDPRSSAAASRRSYGRRGSATAVDRRRRGYLRASASPTTRRRRPLLPARPRDAADGGALRPRARRGSRGPELRRLRCAGDRGGWRGLPGWPRPRAAGCLARPRSPPPRSGTRGLASRACIRAAGRGRDRPPAGGGRPPPGPARGGVACASLPPPRPRAVEPAPVAREEVVTGSVVHLHRGHPALVPQVAAFEVDPQVPGLVLVAHLDVDQGI